jgi:E3 ubiquitin-protein ligase RHF
MKILQTLHISIPLSFFFLLFFLSFFLKNFFFFFIIYCSASESMLICHPLPFPDIKSQFQSVLMDGKRDFFSGNTTMADLGSEVRREVNAGIATVSRMMERLETRDDERTSSVLNNVEDGSVAESNNQQVPEVGGYRGQNEGVASRAWALARYFIFFI